MQGPKGRRGGGCTITTPLTPTRPLPTPSPAGRRWALPSLAGNGGLGFFVATLAYNAGNFAFHMAMSRMLGPGGYGALGSLLGLVTVAVLPVSALQAAVTQAVAERRARRRGAGSGPVRGDPSGTAAAPGAPAADRMAPRGLARPFRWSVLAAAGVLAVLAAVSPVVDRFTSVASPVPLVLLGTYVATSVGTIVPQGVLIGRLRFRPVAASLVVGSVVRLVSGVVLVGAGLGLDAAAAASALSGIASLAVVLWPLRSELGLGWGAGASGDATVAPAIAGAAVAASAGAPAASAGATVTGAAAASAGAAVAASAGATVTGAAAASAGAAVTASAGDAAAVYAADGDDALRLRAGPAVLAVVALAGVSAFLGVDSLLARHYLSRVAAGDYVAAATAARVALFLPGAVAMTAFPRLAAARHAHHETRRLLADTLLLTAVLSGGAAAAIAAFPHLVIAVLFGPAYQSASGPLALLSAAAAAMGLASVLVYFFLAQRSVAATACWLAVGLLATLVAVEHRGLDTIAWLTLAVTAGIALVMAAVAFGQRHPDRARRPRSRPAADASTAAGSAGDPDALLPGAAAVDLTLVVPAHDPGDRLRATVEGVVAALAPTGASYEVVVVSDGSSDGSEATLGGLPPQVRSLVLPARAGKGEAVRVGMAAGRGRYLGFIDGDGDIPPDQVAAFATLTRDGPDLVVASKRHPRSEVVSPPLRRLGSLVWRLAVAVLFRLPVRDTQTGLKLVRRDVLQDVLPRLVERRYAFDLELLVVARRLGHDRVVEAPVRIRRRAASTVDWRAVAGMGRDLLAVFYRLRVLHSYDGHRPRFEEVPAPAAEEAVV